MKYVRLVQWSVERDSIRLEMLGEDDGVHHFDVSVDCAGGMVAALAAECEMLNAEDKDLQFIRPTGMQTAKTAQGEPVILISLKGGVELPLVFRPESLTVLVSELQGLMRVVQPGSEVRWQ